MSDSAITAFARLVGMQAAFEATGNPCARLDAEILLSHALGWPPLRVYSDRDHVLDVKALATLAGMQARRLAGEPVAYIIGVQEFWGLEFTVGMDTLIPRADTETLVEAALASLKGGHASKILDLGTGTGCILLSLLSELPDATGVGSDVSEGAVSLARQNADRLGLATRARFTMSDWFSEIMAPEGGFHAVVSNPPYIPAGDISDLMTDVRDFEPMSALDGGADGLDPYRLITRDAPTFLADGGLLAVEVGVGQADDVMAMFERAGFAKVRSYTDLAGIVRVVSGKKVQIPVI
ncbi:peptide chain release factor N(5)-glutamine methyltransferase [Kordiimonas aestuarii]|uniref:peptide chain release factor N(5)-glutamine methyltransferase n=1 Tax=Kordiimonas aestuarii TaxID=1005925 RepID=UPI0021D22666|nr:peptide chain release factor N(5)-glutamine methyltransferase [Kordiimonas aestuarii]